MKTIWHCQRAFSIITFCRDVIAFVDSEKKEYCECSMYHYSHILFYVICIYFIYPSRNFGCESSHWIWGMKMFAFTWFKDVTYLAYCCRTLCSSITHGTCPPDSIPLAFLIITFIYYFILLVTFLIYYGNKKYLFTYFFIYLFQYLFLDLLIY